MSGEEIEAMSDEEILKLGEPILTATENTIKLSDKTLQELKAPAAEMADRFQSMSKYQHNELSSKFEQVIRKNEGDQPTLRNLDAAAVKSILLDYAGTESGTMQMSSTCSSMFNVQNGYVLLYPGDNLHLANSSCPSSSEFYVHSGTYYSSYVQYSKSGNTWVGVGTNPVIMNGQNSIDRAFYEGLNNNSISWIEIKNYTHHGIYSDNGSADGLAIRNMKFYNIAPNEFIQNDPHHGQEHGAIMILNAENIEVRDNYFEKVASSIRFRGCNGPLKVLENIALNSGRNFFQCDNCNGANIKINDNSMERTAAYGDAVLEDWINIYKSKGSSSSWIEVKHNRARGHSNSPSGSMLILGDEGGEYQRAENNIGVNPGQVGIGLAGGHDMQVINNNRMFSQQWTYSNAGFYSRPDATPCSDHTFPTSPVQNKADWICDSGASCGPVGSNNYAWAPELGNPNCGINFDQIRANVQKDLSLDENVWNQW